MKSKTYKILSLLAMFSMVAVVLVSCKKDDEDEDKVAEKLFKPATISGVNGPTSVTISWPASQFAPAGLQYQVEVSGSADFATIAFTKSGPELSTVVTDADIEIKVDHFARVKALAIGEFEDSDWTISSAFRITGEQIFLPIQEAEVKDVSATLRWTPTEGVSSIVISSEGASDVTENVSSEEATAGVKLIEGLTASTAYTAEIFAGTVSKGTVTFSTKEPSIYDLIISPGDNFKQMVENAADGSLIGVEPGEYDIKNEEGTEFVSLNIVTKKLTIESTSGNPANTIVNFREFNLRGNGAGVTFKGITFDGAKSSANGQSAEYFMNLRGETTDGGAANFDSFVIDNCIVKNMNNCYFRANRANNNDHKIELVKVHNSIIYNSGLVAQNYGLFIFNKLEFKRFELTNSTFYKAGRSFIDLSATITMAQRAVLVVDKCTINGWGSANGNKWLLVDANATDLEMNITNSIFANAPYPNEGTTRLDLFRTNGANSVLNVTNTNLYNLTSGNSEALNAEVINNTPLVIPATVATSNVTAVTLPWTFDATDFSLPAGSSLRTASTTNGPIGDPRWAN